ncbi:MAG: hypothetical protein NZ516_12225 [Raineya sp.]|nr:hypothetical protein [Raineya sp.]
MKKTLLLLAFLSACQVSETKKGNNSPHQKLFDEVMAIHDEVMPSHHIIAKYRDTLSKELQELEKEKDTAKLNRYKQIHQELDYAYKAMDLWMREFDENWDKKSPDEQKAYLEKEKEKITKVSEKMKKSLEMAKNRK